MAQTPGYLSHFAVGRMQEDATQSSGMDAFRKRLLRVREAYWTNRGLHKGLLDHRDENHSDWSSSRKPRGKEVPLPTKLTTQMLATALHAPSSSSSSASEECTSHSLDSAGAASSSQEWVSRRADAREAPELAVDAECEPASRHIPDDKKEAGGEAPAPRRATNDRTIDPGTTTLCIRNIPSRYTHEDLMNEWTDHASFDFLFRPYSFAQKRNLGYALINFVTPEAAMDFYRQWHGQRLSDHGRTRELSIVMGEVQGYKALLRNFSAKILAIKNPAVLPVILSDGRPLDPQAEARSALQAKEPQLQRFQ